MSARLQIQFLGLNEGDDPKNLPPGTLLRAENVRMDKSRRLGKRRGVQGLAKTALSGSNIATGKRLVTNGTDLLMTDGQTLWSYAEPVAKWAPIDRPPSWEVTKRPLVTSTRSVSAVDTAISGDLIVTLYIATGVYVKVDRLSTGATVLSPTCPANIADYQQACPRVLISGDVAYLLWSTSGSVCVSTLNLTTMAIVVREYTLTSSAVTGSPMFDAVIGTPTAGVPTLYLAYELASGTHRARIASFTLSTFASVATLDSVGTGLRAVCVMFAALANKVCMVFSSTTSVVTKITTCTTALGSQVGPSTVEFDVADSAFIAEFDATNMLVGWTRNAAAGDASGFDRLGTQVYGTTSHSLNTASRRTTYGVYAVTKPWSTGGRWFVGATTYVHPDTSPSAQDPAQPSNIVLEIEIASSITGVQDATHPHVATLQNYTGWFATAPLYDINAGGPNGGQGKPSVDSDGNVWLAAPFRLREPEGYTTSLSTPTGWDLFKLTASGGSTFTSANCGPSTLCAGGAPSWSDGSTASPYGFAHAPVITAISVVAGGAMVAGVYSYVATYSWIDVRGVRHRSAPSAPVTGTTAGGNLTLTITVATCSISPKVRTLTSVTAPNPVAIELWRTTAGGTGPHYRLNMDPSASLFVNDARAATVSLSDPKGDSSIGPTGSSPTIALNTQEQLYTDLGELENIPPPSFITCVTHRGRIAGIGPDLRTVWLSKDSTLDPTIAPGFNEALTLAFAHDKTALASLDTVLVVFGEDSIEVVHGDGPDAAGNNNTWQIQAVQSDVGCVNPRSVVATPVGVMFESRRGLDMLDRGMNVTDVLGRAIVDTLTSYPNITSAILVAEENEVRFTCDDGTNGIVLAFDYLNKIWFTRKYTDASDTAAAAIKFVDAALVNGVYTLLTAGGQVYRESATSYLDGGTTYVETDILLAPISAQPGRTGWSNDNLAWQRVKDLTIMGTSVANHDLAVSFALNYANTFTQTHRFLANAVGTPTAIGPLEKARVTANVQKCQAFQIRIRDLAPTGNSVIGNASAGPILESLCLRVGPKDGGAKTTAGQQA